MSQKLRESDKVKLALLEKFKAKLTGAGPLVKNSMLSAFEQGLDAAFEWVRDFNESRKSEGAA